MDRPLDDDRPPRLLPRVLVWAVVGLAVLIVLNWVLSAVFALVRVLFLVGLVVGVGWLATRGFDRD